jgi:hypothetical protein
MKLFSLQKVKKIGGPKRAPRVLKKLDCLKKFVPFVPTLSEQAARVFHSPKISEPISLGEAFLIPA